MSNLYNNPASNNSYGGIISALRQLSAVNGVVLSKEYPSNYRGIIEAILDLGLIGDVHNGEIPPGWKPIYDEDGNIIGGDWVQYPRDGQLWFDTRQGRLFIWEDGAFYQCNGADGLTVVGDEAPQREVIGGLWYNTTNNNLYLYNGTQWTIVGGSASIDTASLVLANPTLDDFENNQPILPDTSGLVSQADYNNWIYDAFIALETEVVGIEPEVPLYKGATPPDEVQDLWYDTANLRLLVRYDGAYVPTSTPLSNDDDFVGLTAQVASNYQVHGSRLTALQTSIDELRSLPHHTYAVTTDKNINVPYPKEIGIYIGNNDNEFNGVEISGSNGAAVTSGLTSINISTKELEDKITAIEADYLVNTDKVALQVKDADLQSQISAIDYVSTSAFNELEAKVNQLPSAAEVSTRLSTAGGHLQGDISMNGNLITGLPLPGTNSGAATKLYVDNLRSDAEATYFKKTDGTLNNVSIKNNNLSKGGIDFSELSTYGQNALKFKTNVGTNYVTFGTNDNFWEYAWDFGGKEDFCWRSDGSKVVSITDEGLTATKLTIGEFQPNTVDGQSVVNKIDIGERLASHETTLRDIKRAIQNADSFDEFKAVAETLLGI